MTSVAEPGGEAGDDTAAGVSGLSAAALASWGNADVERDSNRRPAGCDPVPRGFKRWLSSGDLALERGFRAGSTPAHSQGGAAPSCGPPPASANVEQARAAARLYRGCVSDLIRVGRRSPRAAGAAPVEQAELERQLSSSRSAPTLRPAAARGWPARRRPPAARSSGRPGPRRPARAAAWPPRQRDRERQHAELAVGLHALESSASPRKTVVA